MKLRPKTFLPQSLLGRSLLILVLPVLLVQLVSAYIFFNRHWENVTRHMSNGLAGEMAFVVHQIKPLSPEQKTAVLKSLERLTDIDAKFDPGAVIEKTKGEEPMPFFANALRDRVDMPLAIRSSDDGKRIRVSFALPDGVLQLGVSFKRLDSATTVIYLMWMIGSATFFCLIAVLFLRNQIRPISRLAEAAESFGRGKDLADFCPSGATEVRRAAKAFIIMRERIKRQLRTRSDMLSGVSHDLRTPLARMKLQLEMLPAGKEVDGLKSDVSQMQHMIDEYLDYARGEGREEVTRLWSGDIIREVVEAHLRVGHQVTFDEKDNVILDIRRQAFSRMLQNLVENAVRYGKRCHITANASGDYLELYVDDEGEGIPAEHHETVFKPFMRLDESRHSEPGGGVGLGMTIARDVVLAHGGSIFLTTAPSGGLRVIVRLPI